MAAVDLTTHPGHLARRLQQAHHLLWNAMVSEEITSPQFAVLNTLVAEPGLDQRTVGERVGLDRSTIAEVINRLGRRGLVDKVRDPQDGRRSLLRLTDEGDRVHRRLTVRTARMNQVFLAPLSAEEREQFFDLIRRVSDAAEGLRNPDGAQEAAALPG
jgi:MarR family transcriptional regulator, temperature-dependent positive regulator of motility